ncbi:MAG: glycosyl hydrolase [Gammaproteobacteria bacterium]|nr:MAG: glycosyl hydrolase [Gammaproteobacteria bacterium]
MIFMKSLHVKVLIPVVFLLSSSLSFALGEKPYLTTSIKSGDFKLVGSSSSATLYVDSQDYPGVKRAAKNLQIDIEKVTSRKPILTEDKQGLQDQVVIIGTIGHSQLIDELVASKKIDVHGIKDQWDAYQLSVVQNPTPNIKQALVIVGSNKRGTTYGIYDLSEQIGVSPWYWWADVPAKKKSTLSISKNTHVLEMPKVKYRGIFLNDEAPALTNWVVKNYGNFNHEFYEHVFELLLRLKANFLWPAMWNNSFNADDPLNMELADEYGIVMSTSHHEPMMRAHKEWTTDEGKWDYHGNKKNIFPFWKGGVERNKNFESVITVGMRGDGDEPMSESENISLLENIVKDQRDIISQVFNKPAEQVPQVWALYKEVQGYYDKGMRVPDDVTLLWCDDNWGNIRRLPTPEERKRSGGAGVYYHFDYVGGPRSYRWINTNSIAKIWEQMNLAYQYDANKIWIVNVGDLKPMEYPIEYFLRMAWNPEQWPKERISEYGKLWAAREFGEQYANEIAELMTGYTRHNMRRKPELQDEKTYSQLHYREADRMTEAVTNLRSKAEQLYTKIPAESKNAFFQLVLHPVKASAIITEMYDMVGKNHLYAEQGRAYANEYGDKARLLFNADQELQKQFDTELSNGKWKGFMDQPHIGYTHWNNPPANTMPLLYDAPPHDAADMGVGIEGNSSAWPQQASSVWPHTGNYSLARFDRYGKQTRTIEVFNKGTEAFTFSVKTSDPWIIVKFDNERVVRNQIIKVSIDWNKAPKGEIDGTINIVGTGWGGALIKISAIKTDSVAKNFKGFIESDGYVAIEAEHFAKSQSVSGYAWQKIPEHGRNLSSMSVYPLGDTSFTDLKNAPYLEYNIYFFSKGTFNLDSIFAPTLPFAPERGLRYAVAVDDEQPQIIDIASDKSNEAWEESVRSEMRKATSKHAINSAGAHKLRIYAIDPAVVLERIEINTGGLLPSYLGPEESPRVK